MSRTRAGGSDAPYRDVYDFSQAHVIGVVGVVRFISLFNPANSRKVLILLSVEVEQWSNIASTADNALLLARITAQSGGVPASGVNKWVTASSNPVAQILTNNPTVTIIPNSTVPIASWGPNQTIVASGPTAVARRVFDPNPNRQRGEFLLVPGEGVVLHQSVIGDVDQRYNMTLVWAER